MGVMPLTVESARAESAAVLVPVPVPELVLNNGSINGNGGVSVMNAPISSRDLTTSAYNALTTQARPMYEEQAEACVEVVGKYKAPVPPVKTGVVTCKDKSPCQKRSFSTTSPHARNSRC